MTSIIKQDDYKRMPWKNGLGETLEIYRVEDAAGVRFRISQAAVVEDGLFSDFSGLHRTLVLLSGNGMTLKHIPLESTLQETFPTNKLDKTFENQLEKKLDIARFSGSDETYATLKNDAIEDLNIMVRKNDTLAKVEACFAPKIINVPSDHTYLMNGFYAAENCTIKIKDAEELQLHAHCFLLFEQEKQLNLHQGNGIFIQIIKQK